MKNPQPTFTLIALLSTSLFSGAVAAAQAVHDAGAGSQWPGPRTEVRVTDGSEPAGPGMAAIDRAVAIQRFGLHDPALNLTAMQRTQIDKAADIYISEMSKVALPAGGARLSSEANTLRAKARDNLIAAVKNILDAGQERVWEASPAARRPQIGSRSSSTQ